MAFHGIFEPMLQTPSNYAAFIGEEFNTTGAQDLSGQFKTYLKNFVKAGNPNDKSLTKWTAWTDKNNVLRLDANKEKAIVEDTVDTETAEDILKKMEKDMGVFRFPSYVSPTEGMGSMWVMVIFAVIAVVASFAIQMLVPVPYLYGEPTEKSSN